MQSLEVDGICSGEKIIPSKNIKIKKNITHIIQINQPCEIDLKVLINFSSAFLQRNTNYLKCDCLPPALIRLQHTSQFKQNLFELTIINKHLSMCECKITVCELKEQVDKLKLSLKETKEELEQTKKKLSTAFDKCNKQQKMLLSMRNIQLHSVPQNFKAHFTLEGLKVTYNSTHNWTNYIFNQPLAKNQSGKFKIKILTTKNVYLGFGVVDFEREKQHRYCNDLARGNSFCYSQSTKYPQNVKEGTGFKEGDIVELDINRAGNILKYIVNGVVQATQKNGILTESQRVLYPFVQMCDAGDTIEWLLD